MIYQACIHKHSLWWCVHHCKVWKKKLSQTPSPDTSEDYKQEDDFWNIRRSLKQNTVWGLFHMAPKPSWSASLFDWCGWSSLLPFVTGSRLIVGCAQSMFLHMHSIVSFIYQKNGTTILPIFLQISVLERWIKTNY